MLDIVFEKCDSTTECKRLSVVLTPELSSQTVQTAGALGSVPQIENHADIHIPYSELSSLLLYIAAVSAAPPYPESSELPTLQANNNKKSEVSLSSMERGMVTPKGRASAAPDDDLRNTEVGAAYEIGEWTRLTASDKKHFACWTETFQIV